MESTGSQNRFVKCFNLSQTPLKQLPRRHPRLALQRCRAAAPQVGVGRAAQHLGGHGASGASEGFEAQRNSRVFFNISVVMPLLLVASCYYQLCFHFFKHHS